MGKDPGLGAARAAAAAAAAMVAGALLAARCLMFSPSNAFDDAFMYLRYGRNLLRGALAWNPGGPPVYGLTGPLYLLATVPADLLLRPWPALALEAASYACGCAYILLLALSAETAPAPPARRRLALAAVLWAQIFKLPDLPHHFVSGMETTMALAAAMGYILLARGLAGAGRARVAACGAMGAACLWIRPELLLYAAAAPGFLLLSREPGARRRGAACLAVTAALLVLGMAGCRLYFGSPLPLSFFAKTGDLYGPEFRAAYAGVAAEQGRRFLAQAAWLLAPVVLDLATGFREFLREGPSFRQSLMAATCAFWLYHRFLVVPIMFYQARFYFPALAAIAYLALDSLMRLAARAGAAAERRGRAVPPAAAAAMALLLLAWLGYKGATLLPYLRMQAAANPRAAFALDRYYAATWSRYWVGLDAFAALPDDISLATTEVGLPGAMAPHKRIYDLAGLNAEDFDGRPFAPARFFARHRPDLIYLPNPDYVRMDRDLRADAFFRSAYELHPAAPAGGRMDLALLRSSPRYPALRGVLDRLALPPAPQ